MRELLRPKDGSFAAGLGLSRPESRPLRSSLRSYWRRPLAIEGEGAPSSSSCSAYDLWRGPVGPVGRLFSRAYSSSRAFVTAAYSSTSNKNDLPVSDSPRLWLDREVAPLRLYSCPSGMALAKDPSVSRISRTERRPLERFLWPDFRKLDSRVGTGCGLEKTSLLELGSSLMGISARKGSPRDIL